MERVTFDGVTWSGMKLYWAHNPDTNTASLEWGGRSIPSVLQDTLREYTGITISNENAIIGNVNEFSQTYRMVSSNLEVVHQSAPRVRLPDIPSLSSLSTSQNPPPDSTRSNSDGGASSRRPHSDRSHHRSPKGNGSDSGRLRLVRAEKKTPPSPSSSSDVATPVAVERHRSRRLHRTQSQKTIGVRVKKKPVATTASGLTSEMVAALIVPLKAKDAALPRREYLSITAKSLCESDEALRRDTLEYLGPFEEKCINPRSEQGPLIPSTLFSINAMHCVGMCQNNLRLSPFKRALMEGLQFLFDGPLNALYGKWMQEKEPDKPTRRLVFTYFQEAIRAAMVMSGSMTGPNEFERFREHGHTFMGLLDKQHLEVITEQAKVLRENLLLSRLLVLTGEFPQTFDASKPVDNALQWMVAHLREGLAAETLLPALQEGINSLRPILRRIETVMLENQASKAELVQALKEGKDKIFDRISLKALLCESMEKSPHHRKHPTGFWKSKKSATLERNRLGFTQLLEAFALAFEAREYRAYVSILKPEVDKDIYCSKAIANAFRAVLEDTRGESPEARVKALVESVKRHINDIPLQAREAQVPCSSSSVKGPA
ncbi:hypothetical protein Lgee_1696 [Legionella geestiana]|uniref:Uncharacterized protein n=1 Tax=Legionella geestiana TaxID=45065 RepID=A0A0W0TQX4_9GAMM|nr:hypothetical protein [Legionella geestiana]KTC97882.1 hypothetical protein Lgee_1696 [Legionella geestiana]QBS12994.1 hypothetical protein E4T54_09735 [Legionella geestiana]STX54499.1 Uncharacterised protein [Legionella geestiana]